MTWYTKKIIKQVLDYRMEHRNEWIKKQIKAIKV